MRGGGGCKPPAVQGRGIAGRFHPMNDRFYHAADFSGEKNSPDTNLLVAATAIKKIGQPASEEFKKLASRPLPENCDAAMRGGEQRNEKDQSVTQLVRMDRRRELDSVGVVGRGQIAASDPCRLHRASTNYLRRRPKWTNYFWKCLPWRSAGPRFGVKKESDKGREAG